MGVDPSSGRIYVAWSKEAGTNSMFQSYSGSPYFAYSDDGGKTFSAPVAISDDPDEIGYSRPSIEVTPKGTVLVVWERALPDTRFMYGQEKLRIARSTDAGKTFKVSDLLSDPTPTMAIFPGIHVNAAGVASILWLDYRHRMDKPDAEDIPVKVLATTSKDDGATWSAYTVVSEASCTCCRVSVTSRPGGPWVGSFRGFDPVKLPDDTIRDLVVSRSTDDGATWDPVNKIHNDDWHINGCPVVGPAVKFDASGGLHAVWYTGAQKDPGVFYARSMDDGHTFAAPVPLMTTQSVSMHMHGGSESPSADVGVPSGTDPSVAIDASGSAWASWTDGGSPRKVHLARIDASGKLDLRTTLDVGTSPQLATATGTGSVAMVWGEEGATVSASNTIWFRSITK